MTTVDNIDAALNVAAENESHVTIAIVCANEAEYNQTLDALAYEGERGGEGLTRHYIVATKVEATGHTIVVQYDGEKPDEPEEDTNGEVDSQEVDTSAPVDEGEFVG